MWSFGFDISVNWSTIVRMFMTIKKVTMLYGKLNEHKDISHYDYFSKSEVKSILIVNKNLDREDRFIV